MRNVFFTLLTLFLFSGLVAQNEGALDPTYGTQGVAVTPLTGGINNTYGSAVAADGSIYMFGHSYAENDSSAIVVKYDANGNIDAAFGINGQAKFTTGVPEDVFSFAKGFVDKDGNLVVAGSYRNETKQVGALLVVRFKSDGALDLTFSNGSGSAVLTGATLADIKQFGDDQILIAGTLTTNQQTTVYGAVALNANGALDAGFGTGGFAYTDLGQLFNLANTVALQKDGSFIISGASVDISTFTFTLSSARFTKEGQLDPTFGSNSGYEIYDINSALTFQLPIATTVNSDNEQYTLVSAASDTEEKLYLFKTGADGLPDSGFGTDGKTEYDLTTFAPVVITLDDHERLLLAGQTGLTGNLSMELRRYDAAGAQDVAFGQGGSATADITESFQVSNVIFTPAGKVLVTGTGGFDLETTTGTSFGSARFYGKNIGTADFKVAHQVSLYPNPVVNTAKISYELVSNENINITLTNAEGRMIKSIVSNQAQGKGTYAVNVNFDDNQAPGIYFINISNGKGVQSVKIIKQ